MTTDREKKPAMKLELCGGCNAKMGLLSLQELLRDLPRGEETAPDPNLLLSFDSSDDAAVYRIGDGKVMIQTVDFFPPLLSDPYLFGQAAACNALSDIYAMGGRPVTALNLVCFPSDEDPALLREILRGGSEMIARSGAHLCGGHSVHDPKIKYGLAVTGLAREEELLFNNRGQNGDVLILTKALGTGLLSGKAMLGELSPSAFDALIQSLCTLNQEASTLAKKHHARAMTDVTGFGLIGHLREMLREDLSARLYLRNLPVLEGASEAAAELLITAGGVKNRKALEPFCDFRHRGSVLEELLFDPQTSGGLLIALPPEEADSYLREASAAGLPAAAVGELQLASPGAGRRIMIF